VSKEHQKKIPPRVIKITLDCQKQRRKREREDHDKTVKEQQ